MSSAESRAWVVDASVAFGWLTEVAQSERAVALLEAQPAIELIARDLMLVELLHAGWKAQRQDATTEAQFIAIGELAPTLFSELVPSATLLARAKRWCQELDQPGSTPARQGAAGSAGGGFGDGDRAVGAVLRVPFQQSLISPSCNGDAGATLAGQQMRGSGEVEPL